MRGVVTNGTTLTFDRDQTGQTLDVSWYLVAFTDATTVQQGSELFGTTETQRSVSISGVNLASSIAAGGYFMRGGKSPYSANDNPGVGWFALDLISSTSLRMTRGLTGSAQAQIGWFVVTFP